MHSPSFCVWKSEIRDQREERIDCLSHRQRVCGIATICSVGYREELRKFKTFEFFARLLLALAALPKSKTVTMQCLDFLIEFIVIIFVFRSLEARCRHTNVESLSHRHCQWLLLVFREWVSLGYIFLIFTGKCTFPSVRTKSKLFASRHNSLLSPNSLFRL